ncbi:MAG: thioredoxin domain-containing protein [Bacteroidota bacterium]
MSHGPHQNPNNLHQEPNRLIDANSPYLLQHAYNPVDWQQWGETAWDQAKTENKLVLVSIGYSTCHWCHVMEHESFEDFETAEIMNLHLVSIKVDREERPDIDMIYMDACQIMTGRGGWPLNVICLPNKQPIYVGTYFPKAQWQQVIVQLAEVYQTEPEKAVDYAQRIQEKIHQINHWEIGEGLQRKDVSELFNTLADTLDWQEGGPNRAPKFPLPGQYEFILDHYLLTESEAAKDYLHLSLLKMCHGGIYDVLRGGFCRYSTDAHWFAPHFEKMLYDNAQLVSLYARAFGWSDAPLYKEIVEACLDFCQRELGLGDAGAGFGSALDADSEGMEGKFYVFTEQEMMTLLSEDDLHLARIQFGLKPEGNWEHGYNILHQPLAPLQVMQETGLSAESYLAGLGRIKDSLRRYQDTRVRPGFDDKAICSWNALHIKALADASFYVQSENYAQSAAATADWAWDTFWDGQSLKRIHRKGQTHITGFLEDYAYLCEAFIALYRISRKTTHIEKAETLLKTAIELFFDKQTQQLSFTPHNGEALFYRKSDLNDDVTPSPNAVIALCAHQLAQYRSNDEYAALSHTLIKQVSKSMKQSPGWYFHWCRLAQSQALGGIHVTFYENEVDLWASNEVLTLMKHLPSWALVEYATKNEEKQIVICANHACMAQVDSIEKALEIAMDTCRLVDSYQ